MLSVAIYAKSYLLTSEMEGSHDTIFIPIIDKIW